MFICQTNHALDQILEHVYEFEKNIIRVGGRSESTVMQSLSLTSKQKDPRTVKMNRTSTEFEAREKMVTDHVA